MTSVSTPPAVPPIWTTGSTEVFKTGTWRAALPLHVHEPSPCHRACPVNGDIARWIGLARAGDLRAAWNVLVENNPFPAIAGRICHHPCESACNRTGFDDAVAICKLERFVGDRAIAEGWALPAAAAERAGHVAVLGAGPAGLSAAYQLRRRGWRVTLYEASAALGGLMRHGIPSYRLARDVLDAEVARIVALGVEVRLGAAVATAAQFEALRSAHDALFVAVGAARVKRLPQLDYGAPGVVDGATYLARGNAGEAPRLGRQVVVIGGGSAALDAARSARRAGHEVTIVALESRAQMPAQPEEVDEALEEGIALVDGAMLRQATREDGHWKLACARVRFEPGAARGEFRVTPLDGQDFELRTDTVITSIGQDPDLRPYGDALAAQRGLLAADAHGATGAPGVWAGGDVASLARFVTEAVNMGKRAALAIHATLAGEPLPAVDARPAVPLAAIATWYHPKAARAEAPLRLPAERRADLLEVQLGLDDAQAAAETERCFSCGTCVLCDNCVVVCPDLAVRRVDGDGNVSSGGNGHAAGSAYEVLSDYCKGCGLCVRECPTGSMRMREEAK